MDFRTIGTVLLFYKLVRMKNKKWYQYALMDVLFIGMFGMSTDGIHAPYDRRMSTRFVDFVVKNNKEMK